MNFATLPAAGVVAGLAVLAGVLYLLQRLRVRHKEIVVPTTLFWKEAVEERRARVLINRFRYPWVYLMLFAIAACIWLAFAQPEGSVDSDRRTYTLLIDGSAGMGWGNRLAHAIAEATAEAERLPRGMREVILCGAQPILLLRHGEDARLLERRARGIAADACPATAEAVVRSLATALGGPRTIVLYGAAPLREGLAALLPSGWRLIRRPCAEPDGSNSGIVALGVTEARSGVWGRVDLFVETHGPRAPTVDLDNTVLTPTAGPDSGRLLFADVPALGGRVSVTLSGAKDALALDDHAAVILPNRPPIRIRIDIEGAPALRAALAADDAIRIVDQNPDVLIVGHDQPAQGHPTLRLVDTETQEDAFLLHDSRLDAESVLRSAFLTLGLDAIDSTRLAETAGRPIRVGATSGTPRELSIWGELLTDRFDFARSRAFPIFLARTIRWLHGASAFPAVVAAGRRVTEASPIVRSDGKLTLATAGAAFVPPTAGEYRADGATPLAASLFDLHATLGTAPSAAPGQPDIDVPASGPPIGTWLLLIAIALLLTDWFLFAKGRIP